jgi:hypothetical protein
MRSAGDGVIGRIASSDADLTGGGRNPAAPNLSFS